MHHLEKTTSRRSLQLDVGEFLTNCYYRAAPKNDRARGNSQKAAQERGIAEGRPQEPPDQATSSGQGDELAHAPLEGCVTTGE